MKRVSPKPVQPKPKSKREMKARKPGTTGAKPVKVPKAPKGTKMTPYGK